MPHETTFGTATRPGSFCTIEANVQSSRARPWTRLDALLQVSMQRLQLIA
jgi:hypothetical protein